MKTHSKWPHYLGESKVPQYFGMYLQAARISRDCSSSSLGLVVHCLTQDLSYTGIMLLQFYTFDAKGKILHQSWNTQYQTHLMFFPIQSENKNTDDR